MLATGCPVWLAQQVSAGGLPRSQSGEIVVGEERLHPGGHRLPGHDGRVVRRGGDLLTGLRTGAEIRIDNIPLLGGQSLEELGEDRHPAGAVRRR